MHDSSVVTVKTVDTNKGWVPPTPAQSTTMIHVYQPDVWEPPTNGGAAGELITAGYIRWTRGFLKGIDVGANEVYTGQQPYP
jgi:hypothetical protein